MLPDFLQLSPGRGRARGLTGEDESGSKVGSQAESEGHRCLASPGNIGHTERLALRALTLLGKEPSISRR